MEEKIINENIMLRKNEKIYTIHFKCTSYSIINSLIKTRLITGCSTNEYYNILIFKAESVKTLKEYQDENEKKRGKKNFLIVEIAKMIRTLSKQLEYLIDVESKGILGYDINNIIVINNENFVFLGSELIADIDKDTEFMTIDWPFSKNDFFLSPELLKIKEIPSKIHFKSSYFSLACLIIHCLVADNEFYKNYLNNSNLQEIMNELKNHPIKNTRIYWLLSRCLVEEVKDRSIIML